VSTNSDQGHGGILHNYGTITSDASAGGVVTGWGDGATTVGVVAGSGTTPAVTTLTDDPLGTAHVIGSGTVLVAPPPMTDGGTGGGGGGAMSGGGCSAAPLPCFLPAAWLLRRRRERRVPASGD
jgi:hypothetical protein